MRCHCASGPGPDEEVRGNRPDLFGWTFAPFADPEEAGVDYRVATQAEGGPPFGGVLATGGAIAPHAIFSIAVADVGAMCRATEKLGGTVELGDQLLVVG